MPTAQRSKETLMISALRARGPLAALVLAALAGLGQPPDPGVRLVAHRAAPAPAAAPIRSLVGDDAAAFTPIFDPADPDDDQDEPENRDGSNGGSDGEDPERSDGGPSRPSAVAGGEQRRPERPRPAGSGHPSSARAGWPG